MKFMRETTNWGDATPNHTYILTDRACIGYIKAGTNEVQLFKRPMNNFDQRNRSFTNVSSKIRIKITVADSDFIAYNGTTKSVKTLEEYIMKFAAKDGVKWTSSDENGSFSYEGVVVAQKDGNITFKTSEGQMTVPETEGSFEAIKTPKLAKKVQPLTPKTKATKAQKSAGPRPGSKVDQIITLLKGKDVSRKEAIALIVDAGISSAAGASTHYNSAKAYL